MSLSKRYKNKIIPLYQWFLSHFDILPPSKIDYSHHAAISYYEYESKGVGSGDWLNLRCDKVNFCALAKHWLGVQVDNWKYGIQSGLFNREHILSDVPIAHHWYFEKLI